ncbi:MAG: rod shape-determining protein RodA [Marinifilaceae bacterium]|nr:rod shape-determining protein RodA [Marinifilaceae bacterium]
MLQRGYRQTKLFEHLDWLTVLIYVALIFMGWISIYAAVYDETHSSIFDISQRYGKQLLWMGIAGVIGFVILLMDSKFFTMFAIPLYILMLGVLVLVLKIGTEVNGARAWFDIGSIRIQPAEFAKITTCLAMAKIMGKPGFKITKVIDFFKAVTILAIPALLIILQNDTGSALVYSSFILVMYREGLPQILPILLIATIVIFIFTLMYPATAVLSIIIFGTFVALIYYRQHFYEVFIALAILIALYASVYGVTYFLNMEIESYHILLSSYLVITIGGIIYYLKKHIKKVIPILLLSWMAIGGSYGVSYIFPKLPQHQQDRINLVLGKIDDPKNIGYNVNQSQIAIGSGGLTGKGFLNGTQTKYEFVPEQETDFIFCTVGEEWGFLGSSLVILLMSALIMRIIALAERQRSAFSRIYGLGVAGILFFHLTINIGMTIGLTPVIGIPLPFFSYGGSSLWAFTILIFIFLKLDSNRMQAL